MPENAAAEGGFGRDAPDRSRDTDNNRGGAREDKESRTEKAESFDRAMDNANRPDRAPAAPADTTTASDDDDDDKKTDKTEDRPDSAAGPPGIGAPPSTSSPSGAANEPEEDDPSDEGGLLDRVTDVLTAPPTDAEGNARSTSQVADRVRNHTVNYSLDNVFGASEPQGPGLTPEQSATLAQSAAVMNGYALGPAIPSTADLVLDDVLQRAPGPMSATPIRGERDWAGYVANGGAFGAGMAVGAGARAVDLATELPGAALESVSMVNDAAGTVLDTALGWTGIDLFEGHAERNAARGQAMVEGVVGLPDQIAEGWDDFTGNIAAGNYYDAGRQMGGLTLDAAGIAVPASKVATLGKVDTVDGIVARQPADIDVPTAKSYQHTQVQVSDVRVNPSTITDGTYTVNPSSMARHKPDTAPSGKSVFRSDVDAEKAVLDAARYADAHDMWEDGKAKVPVKDGETIGYDGRSGEPRSHVNIYREEIMKDGATYSIHGTPGNAPR